MFKKYMHVERFGNTEVEGIEFGECYIFPKIDGSNGSVWMDGHQICAGSRNRQLTLDNDNQGFLAYVLEQDNIIDFFRNNEHLTLFGEWLVPHSLKTYREEAWRKFYIFDVFDNVTEKFLDYETYSKMLDEANIEYIPPIAIIKNCSYESLLKQIDCNFYLIKDGEGKGEGIVVKNYNFVNKYNRTVWAKIVTNEFKEKNQKAFGPNVKESTKMIEEAFVDKYVDFSFVDKVYQKIVNNENGWSSKMIPRLLQTVFYDLVNEECWDFIKNNRYPVINFRTLNTLAIIKIKKYKPELF